jgi:hypothetical protein
VKVRPTPCLGSNYRMASKESVWWRMRPSTLVVYHYFEKSETYRNNFAHFLLFGYRKDVDYLILISADTTHELPCASNIKVVNVENHNLDFGAYTQVFALENEFEKYQTIHFVNCSVRGPFLPTYVTPKLWLDIMRDGYTQSNAAIFGSTICLPGPNSLLQDFDTSSLAFSAAPHVQSFNFVISGSLLNQLRIAGFFDARSQMPKAEVIWRYEIGLSDFVLRQGLSISCLLPEYAGITDWSLDPRLANGQLVGDPNYLPVVQGRKPHPFETLMAKSINRTDALLQLSLAKSMAIAHEPQLRENLKSLGNPSFIAEYLQDLKRVDANQLGQAETPRNLNAFGKLVKKARQILR